MITTSLTRQQAIAEGKNRHFTGKPCKNGHVADRYVTGGCTVCCDELRRKSLEKRRGEGADVNAKHRRYRSRNSEKCKARCKSYRENHPALVAAQMAEWEKNNRDRRREITRRTAERLRVQIQARRRVWEKKNRARRKWIGANRRAAKISATPPWVDRDELRRIYSNVPVGHHVDHIVPLRNPLVCGLHVPCNLQYLPAIQNLRKGNRL